MSFIKHNKVEDHKVVTYEERKRIASVLQKSGKNSVAELTDDERQNLHWQDKK